MYLKIIPKHQLQSVHHRERDSETLLTVTLSVITGEEEILGGYVTWGKIQRCNYFDNQSIISSTSGHDVLCQALSLSCRLKRDSLSLYLSHIMVNLISLGLV